MSQTKAQLLDNIKDNVQLDARNSLRFADTDSSHYVAFKAPATVSSNVTWTLPAADGSANYVLATDGSGNLSWIADPAGQWVTTGSHVYFSAGNVGIGDSSPSNPLSVTGASAFNGDVTLTGASYNAVWDKSDNALEFADSAKASFGAGVDLSIYHTDPNGFIKYQNENGHLRILSGVSGNGGIQLKNRTDDATYLTCISEGAVELYHNNVKKAETSSSGLSVTGQVTVAGSGVSLSIADSGKAAFGTGDDLQIYHNGSHSYIDNGTGDTYIRPDGLFYIIDKTSNDVRLVARNDGNVELYYDNSKKFETTTDGIKLSGNGYADFPDNGRIRMGADYDLAIYHDGSHARLNNATGNFNVQTGKFVVTNAANSENIIIATADGAVELYHDSVKKFETTSTGIIITGSDVSGSANLGSLYFKNAAGTVKGHFDTNNSRFRLYDSFKLTVGSDDDLQIYHDGTHSYLKNTGGNIVLQGNGTNSIVLQSVVGENALICNANTSVELYYDNSKKFETTSDGAKITATTGTGLEISQTHTAHGQGPAILINSNGAYNDGYIRYNLGNETSSWALGVDDSEDCFGLYFSGTTTTESPANAGRRIIANESGSVELYHNDSKKFETTSDGVKLSGTGDVTFIINADTDNSGENDNPLLKFQQDGAVDCLGIGVIGDAGEYFTNSSQNSPYIAALGGHGGLGMEFATNGTRRMRINHGGTIDGDFNDTSDGNLKENIVSIGSSIDKVKTLRPVTFDWKDTTKSKNYSGFIAQEVKTVYPNLISGEEHTAEEPWKNYSLNTTGLVAYLTKALQEAITKIETLETKVAALESA